MFLSPRFFSINFILFILGAIFACLSYLIPSVSPHATIIALLLGILLANTMHTPVKLGVIRKHLLNTAIVLFGFGLDINVVIKVGALGLGVTFISLVIVVFAGYCLLRVFKIEKITGQLITYGTSICGGSAIAAVSGVLRANGQQISMAMAYIFMLNALALLFFPPLGHWLALSDEAFGTLCALAIHDVSSVVGAASQFSQAALETATILKLTRILWMIPIVLILGKLNKTEGKTRFPTFIVFFIGASLITSFFPLPFTPALLVFGKMLLALALYFIGYNVNLSCLKTMGLKGISFAIALWCVSILSALVLVKLLY